MAGSDAYLTPRTGTATCIAELDLLIDIKNGVKFLAEVKNAVFVKGSGVRVHWGLDIDTFSDDEVHDIFPRYDGWLSFYRQLKTSGMFNSVFTDRLGIPVPRIS